MSKIEIPKHLLSHLGKEMKMDIHFVDVKLKDGTKLTGLVVRGRKFITGQKTDPDGIGQLDFEMEDILNIRRELRFGWPKI